MSRPLATLALTLLGAACAGNAPPQTARPVSGDEMVALLRGNTNEGRTNLGLMQRTYVAEDLSARLTVILASGPPRQFGGRVRPDGSHLCWSWPGIEAGAEACYRLYQEGDRFWSVPDGHQRGGGTFQILPGNPYGL